MENWFLNGFTDELLKLSADPLAVPKPPKLPKPVVKAPGGNEMDMKTLHGDAANKYMKTLPKQAPVKRLDVQEREDALKTYERNKKIKEQENDYAD